MPGTHRVLAGLAGLCLIASLGVAQIRSRAVTGTITDPSGAVIPGATVVVTNEETNVGVEVQTNAAGVYTVPYLGAGRYTVSVNAPGFQTFSKTGIVMGTATTMRVEASLATGTVTTAIEVTADAAVLQTESASVQGAVSQNIIANIPNINNNPLYYAALQAGVVPDPKMYNSKVLGVGFQDRQAMSFMRINGGLMGTSDVQLDGLSVQGAAWHEVTVVPDREALQEVRVVTNSFAADLGNGQGLISMTTKSGTNQFHGSLSYRLRNEALNANGLGNNPAMASRTSARPPRSPPARVSSTRLTGCPTMCRPWSPCTAPPSIGNFGGPITALNADTWRRKRESQVNHALQGSVTKVLNRWTLKAGGDYLVYLGNWQDLLYATPFLNASNHNGQLGGLSGGNSSLITDPALRGISFVSALTAARVTRSRPAPPRGRR